VETRNPKRDEIGEMDKGMCEIQVRMNWFGTELLPPRGAGNYHESGYIFSWPPRMMLMA